MVLPNLRGQLAGAYGGTIFDTMTSQKTPLYLTNIQQNKDQFTGVFYGLGMSSIPFKGALLANQQLKFVANIDGGRQLRFEGTIKVGGDITGEFYVDANG